MRNYLNIFFIALFGLFGLFVLLDSLFPLDTKTLDRPLATRVYDKNHKLLRIHPSLDGFYRFHTDIHEVPPLLKKSILYFEDRYFYQHFGFNPVSITKAFWHNLFSDRKIGASTITMQVARMMHRRPRTFVNKLKELFTALQLEWHYSKDEIFNFYLNLAPYGGNIEGIKTAAWFYFHKRLDQLSIAQMALLTTIPKNPNLNRLDRAQNLYLKRLRVLRQLLKAKLISQESFNRAFKEPIIKKRYKAPFKAPHFTQNFTQGGDVNSSLDINLHTGLLRILYRHVEALKAFGVHNGAGIIIDNRSMNIVAYVGSDRFFDRGHFGQNDGVSMYRSPGSTLKPFIYARALDAGLITPKRRLFDLPLFKQGYDPQNFSGRFSGEISAQEALQNSLNIPAITLNALLEEHSLYELLKEAKPNLLEKEKSYYGDALVLGGFGISLIDLAHLYTAFAHEGKLLTLGKTLDHKPKVITQLFSKEAAYLVNDILSDANRMEFSAYWESAQNPKRIAFKTGTSAQNRDLYTVAVTPEYTIAIWLGDFQGRPTHNQTGIASASPVLFDLLNILPHPLSWFRKPKNLEEKKVCLDAIIFGSCQEKDEDSVIKNLPPKRPCALLRAEVLAYLRANDRFSSAAYLAHECYEVWSKKPPQIAPLYDKQIIKKAYHDKEKNMLKCHSFKNDPKITWLIDKKAPFSSRSGKAYWVWLDKGVHHISCVDSGADMTTITVTVD